MLVKAVLGTPTGGPTAGGSTGGPDASEQHPRAVYRYLIRGRGSWRVCRQVGDFQIPKRLNFQTRKIDQKSTSKRAKLCHNFDNIPIRPAWTLEMRSAGPRRPRRRRPARRGAPFSRRRWPPGPRSPGSAASTASTARGYESSDF